MECTKNSSKRLRNEEKLFDGSVALQAFILNKEIVKLRVRVRVRVKVKVKSQKSKLDPEVGVVMAWPTTHPPTHHTTFFELKTAN